MGFGSNLNYLTASYSETHQRGGGKDGKGRQPCAEGGQLAEQQAPAEARPLEIDDRLQARGGRGAACGSSLTELGADNNRVSTRLLRHGDKRSWKHVPLAALAEPLCSAKALLVLLTCTAGSANADMPHPPARHRASWGCSRPAVPGRAAPRTATT